MNRYLSRMLFTVTIRCKTRQSFGSFSLRFFKDLVIDFNTFNGCLVTPMANPFDQRYLSDQAIPVKKHLQFYDSLNVVLISLFRIVQLKSRRWGCVNLWISRKRRLSYQ